jgi:hypothetical protein
MATDLLKIKKGVSRIGQAIRQVNGFLLQRRPAGD